MTRPSVFAMNFHYNNVKIQKQSPNILVDFYAGDCFSKNHFAMTWEAGHFKDKLSNFFMGYWVLRMTAEASYIFPL
jgi:hypothetical protein